MKFSENWLRHHVPTTLGQEALAARLTSIGLEVTDVQTIGADLAKVVIARVIAVAPHPQADRLKICQVDAGRHGSKQIVCGAANVREGLVAPLALVGACIGGRPIEAVELRSVASAGMLCSAEELGLDHGTAGLLELSADAPVGEDFAQYAELPDTCFDVSLTPNRGDCLSVRGLAYDVAAACQSTVVPFTVKRIPTRSALVLEVKLDAGEAAPVYYGRVIEGLPSNAQTPDWIAHRLQRGGIRPINLYVDVTNYVMLELGQPMHVYDFDQLKGPIRVRHARSQESLVVLDGRTVHCDESMLVVTDDDRPIALAGLIGGQATSVSATTKSIFLEAAHFTPAAMMGRGRRVGYQTEASFRFERGVDPQLAATAMDYATELIIDVTDGRAGPRVHVGLAAEGHTFVAPTIHLRRQTLSRILGIDIADLQVTQILQSLGMQVQVIHDGWQVNSPSRRFDIALEEDLIEEVARIYGYDRIPACDPQNQAPSTLFTEIGIDLGALRRHCQSRGYQETIQFAFIDFSTLKCWSLDQACVPLVNPLSADWAVMRPSLLPGLVASLAKNSARQMDRVRIFEIGTVFHEADVSGAPPQETRHLAAVACGSAQQEQWAQPFRALDFYDIKGDVVSLAVVFGGGLTFHATVCPWLHPGRSAQIRKGEKCIGWVGQIHPHLARQCHLSADVYAFELALPQRVSAQLPRLHPVSRFPSVRRDLSVLVPERVTWAEVETVIHQAAGPLLVQLLVFDRYVGKGVEPGYKSIAIGLFFQEQQRTLIDQQVDAAVATVIAALDQAVGGRVRC